MAEIAAVTPSQFKGAAMNATLARILMAAAPDAASASDPLPLGDGMELETRFDGDFNDDGIADVAFVERSNDDERDMIVLLGYRSETDIGFDPAGKMELDAFPLGPASFSLKKGVLVVDDLVGGTTAVAGTYRFRYDPVKKRMRLIGLDAKQYSRTNNHGWASISWNVLTGAVLREQAALIEGENHSDNAYGPTKSKREKRPSKPIYMEDAPTADSFFDEGN